MRFITLGFVLTAAVLFGTALPTHADDLACLYVLPNPAMMGCTDPMGVGPGPVVELQPGSCAEDCAQAAINVCLSTVGSAGPLDAGLGGPGTPEPGDVFVSMDPDVTVTFHYGVAGAGGVDVETDDFPNTTPTGHAVVWIAPGVPVLGGLHFGIADEQDGCPE